MTRKSLVLLHINKPVRCAGQGLYIDILGRWADRRTRLHIKLVDVQLTYY